jgi:hypothetical protein
LQHDFKRNEHTVSQLFMWSVLFQSGYSRRSSFHYTENGYFRQGLPVIFKLSCKVLYNMLENNDLFYKLFIDFGLFFRV